jgi:predicted O-methyltransferase YrrM
MTRIYPEEFLRGVPEQLRVAEPPPSAEEFDAALRVRKQFLLDGQPEPYMDDVIRAFRLLRGCRSYVEVGTYDKGNLAYVAGLLAGDAVLVDVDCEPRPERTERLKKRLGAGQRLFTVVGDSTLQETCEQVGAALAGRPADAVFIDANHVASFVLNDYALYSRLVRPGGLVLFHDVYWAGDETTPGAVVALGEIDRLVPVHVVFAHDPVHRFLPFMTLEERWGGVGMIIKQGPGHLDAT